MHTTRISGKTMKRTVLFLAIAALFCFTVKAQAQSSIHYLMNDDAMTYIGDLAHPLQKVLDTQYVGGTDSYIDIKIEFESLMRSYWEPYRINLRRYNGVTYAYSIVRTRRVSVHEAFLGLDIATTLLGNVFEWAGYSKSDNDEAIRVLYGVSERDLTKEQKAAIALMNYLYGE